MPKFAVSGHFSPSQLEGVTSNQVGAELKLSSKLNVDRIATGLTEPEAKAFEALYAQDLGLEDPFVDRLGGTVRDLDRSALDFNPTVYLPLNEAAKPPVEVHGYTTSTAAGTTIGPAGLFAAYPSRTVYSLDASNSYIALPASVVNIGGAGSTSHSASAWVRPGTITTTRTILSRRVVTPTGEGWQLTMNSSGQITYMRVVGGASVSAGQSAAIIPFLTANQWAHVGFSYDGNTRVAKVFVNGLMAKALTLAQTHQTLNDISSVGFVVGAWGDLTSSRWLGEIAQVACFNAVLPDYYFRAQWASGVYGPA